MFTHHRDALTRQTLRHSGSLLLRKCRGSPIEGTSRLRKCSDGSFIHRHGHCVEVLLEQVGVDVERHGGGLVSEHPLDGLGVRA